MRAMTTAALGLAMGICGCAPVYLQGEYAYEEGWRQGVVTHLGWGEEINVYANRDCRLELSPERMHQTRFARVRFNNAQKKFSPPFSPSPPPGGAP